MSRLTSLSLTSPLFTKFVSPPVLKALNGKKYDLEVKGMEHCKNPWKNECKSENIKLYIQVKGEKLPICQQCWNRIADQEQEW